jgi:hypothetical protein
MAVAEPDLWELTRGAPQVDPARLAAAVEREAAQDNLDFRTRLLIRDSVDALIGHWGPERVNAWLVNSPASKRIEAVRREDLGAPGFPTLATRLMETTTPQQILGFLRELGTTIHQPARVHVGGSAALIALGRLSRHTDDIDVVDEVPVEVRMEHELLDRLSRRYGLYLAHFQSHYLPQRWEQRVQALGVFGRLEVFVIDAYDIALSKLFSAREKDRDDLRMLAGQLDKNQLAARLTGDGQALANEPRLRDAAAMNWYILYGEPLPRA